MTFSKEDLEQAYRQGVRDTLNNQSVHLSYSKTVKEGFADWFNKKFVGELQQPFCQQECYLAAIKNILPKKQ
jgi:hypothetical protein